MIKALKWILLTICLLIFGAAIFATFIIGMVFHTWSYGVEPDFIAYEPRVPLAGWEVIETTKKNGANNGKSSPSFIQTYSSGVVLSQTKAWQPSERVVCDTHDEPLEGTVNIVFTYSCLTGDTRHGGSYTVTEVFRDGELDRVELRAQIGEARMYVHIPEHAETQIAAFTEWREYFDSMEPIDLKPDMPPALIERTYKFLVYGQQW